MFLKQKFKLLVLFSIIAFSSELHSTEVDYGVSVNQTSFENINRLTESQNPEKEFANSIRGRMRIAENTGKLTAQLDGSIETINYVNNIVDDRNLLNLSAQALMRVQPGQFEWMFSDVFSQIAINVLEADSIPNQQDVNIFTTGPNYLVRLNSKNSLRFELRYLSSRFEVRTTNSDRYISRIIEQHAVNSNFKILFNFNNELVRFKGEQIGVDNSLNTDYLRNDVFLTLEYSKFNSLSSFEIGSTDVFFEGDTVKDQNLVRYAVSSLYNNTRTSSILFRANRSVEDRAINAGNFALNNTLNTNTSAVDLYLIESVRVLYNKIFSLGSISIDPYITRVRYNVQKNLNIHGKGLNLRSEFNLSGRSRFSFDMLFIETDYDNIEPKRIDNDTTYRFLYNYRVRRNVNATIGYTSLQRESTNLNFSYEDARIFVSLEYTSD